MLWSLALLSSFKHRSRFSIRMMLMSSTEAATSSGVTWRRTTDVNGVATVLATCTSGNDVFGQTDAFIID